MSLKRNWERAQPHSLLFMAEILSAEEIKTYMKRVPEWDNTKKHIERTFEFDEFFQSIDFVNGVAEVAEEQGHHPDIDIRFSKVRISISTHSEGGLTDADFDLAEKIDNLAE